MPQLELPSPKLTRFITIMVTPTEEAEITMAATMHPGPDGVPQPLTVDAYLLGLHRAARKEATEPPNSHEDYMAFAEWYRDREERRGYSTAAWLSFDDWEKENK